VLAALLAEIDEPLRWALGGLLMFIVTSTTILTLGYHKPDGSTMTLLDSVYFSIETVTTIGYGDYNFTGQATWLRIVSIALMISGALLLASFFALLTNLLVSRRLLDSLGRRELGRLAGHTVVVGLGSVGLRVVEGIRAEGGEVVVLERDEDNRYLADVRALGVPVVVGDATRRQVLESVNLSTARAVAVMTSDDLTNIETGLAVRDALGDRWRDVPLVLRLFDRRLGHTVERDFGFRHVRSTSALAAPWFVGAALGLDVLGTFTVEQQPFLVGRLQVAAGGGLDGLTMGGLSASIRVVALSRASDGGRLEHPPRRGTRFAADDVAYLVGPYEELLHVLRQDARTSAALG
jgi:Trk K+ transport system NAD-binding subunit